MRVLLVENAQRIDITATAYPTVHTGPGSAEQQLRFAPGVPATVSLSAAGWQIGKKNEKEIENKEMKYRKIKLEIIRII